jgi:hypothetical protein
MIFRVPCLAPIYASPNPHLPQLEAAFLSLKMTMIFDRINAFVRRLYLYYLSVGNFLSRWPIRLSAVGFSLRGPKSPMSERVLVSSCALLNFLLVHSSSVTTYRQKFVQASQHGCVTRTNTLLPVTDDQPLSLQAAMAYIVRHPVFCIE